MVKTIFILIVTFIALPILAFKFDQPLTIEQWQMLKIATYIMLGIAFACFMAGELTGNVSQVDKLWSISPVIYTWYFVIAGQFDSRMVLMAILVTIWGVRLTYNFSRKGAYSWKFWEGEEDYRWSVVRQTPALKGRLRWILFDFFFISLYQNALILLFTLPILVAWQGRNKPLGWADGLVAVVFIGLVIIETISDQQQWSFQIEKHRKIKDREQLDGQYADGFLSSGLFSKVRHPNYAAEQAIWITFYFFSVAATGRWINWSMAGCLLLVVLFQGSSDFSEGISSKKYPGYDDYKKRVPRFLPKLW